MTARQLKMMQCLAQVRPGATLCAGQLARAAGSTLREARTDLLALVRQGRAELRQRGVVVDPATLRGPFRVAPGARADPRPPSM